MEKFLKQDNYQIIDFGKKEYLEILKIQEDLFQKKQNNETSQDYILIGEHFPVYTAGKRTKQEHIYNIPKNIPLIKIERGGSITFHGLGQIVVYPIMDLRMKKLSVKNLVYKLEEAIIKTCRHFNIDVFRKEKLTGIFTKEGKIGFIGLRVSKFITMHGLSLNVNVDKKYFSYINPCGISTEVVNISDYEKANVKKVKQLLLKNILSCL
ncbi:MAG TPA: lipoyl(octanoyl) transferase [Persephonella sp.]|nr:lipoyl(octanoyl) transferase [Persephonella sp.]